MTNPDNDILVDQALASKNAMPAASEPTFSGVCSLFRRRFSKDLSAVDIATLGVPYDLSVTNRPGTRFGPRAIREASSNLSWMGAAWPWGFDPFESLTMVDYGDLLIDHGYPQSILDNVFEEVKTVLESNAFLLSMGGDHSVSYPLIRAHAEKYGPVALVQFDAHSDTWEEPDKRIDHGTMFYHAIQEGFIDSKRSVQIGIRTLNDSSHGCTILDAAYVHQHRSEDIAKKIHEVTGDGPTYVTLDIDALDPAYAPGTGTPVCGGLSTWQLQSILRLMQNINIVGMDLVEVSPPYDHAGITALAASTLLMDCICLRKARLDYLAS